MLCDSLWCFHIVTPQGIEFADVEPSVRQHRVAQGGEFTVSSGKILRGEPALFAISLGGWFEQSDVAIVSVHVEPAISRQPRKAFRAFLPLDRAGLELNACGESR